MVEKEATIHNKAGIHCRPSTTIVTTAAKFADHDIKVTAERGSTDLKGILSLLSMGLQRGDKVKISVCGPDEEKVCNEIVRLFEYEYDFPPQE